MGLYDSLPRGSQVKLWDCEMLTRKVGDSVPDFGLPEYVVLLREGGYVVVREGRITKIVENYGRKFYTPTNFPKVQCFDKWGIAVTCDEELIGQFQGLCGMDDPYCFRKSK